MTTSLQNIQATDNEIKRNEAEVLGRRSFTSSASFDGVLNRFDKRMTNKMLFKFQKFEVGNSHVWRLMELVREDNIEIVTKGSDPIPVSNCARHLWFSHGLKPGVVEGRDGLFFSVVTEHQCQSPGTRNGWPVGITMRTFVHIPTSWGPETSLGGSLCGIGPERVIMYAIKSRVSFCPQRSHSFHCLSSE